jgi:hypothetical protein
MNKLMLTVLLALAGCNAQGSLAGAIGTTRQAETTTPGDPDDGPGELRKLPKLRYVAPGSQGGGGGGGSSGGTGGTVGTWQPLANPLGEVYAGASLLLTDGSIMVQDINSSDWWKLTPDNTGSYVAGTWTKLAAMPNGYQPLYFASAVLPDGRVIIEGGEYQAFQPAWTTLGAIYNPTTDTWTAINPPSGWDYIGDAQSVVLADGRFMLASCCSTAAAIFDPKTLTWTAIGTGKADINDEEGWTLLPNNKVLTIDANNVTTMTLSEIFSPVTAAWTSAGSTVVPLADLTADGGGSHELGPAMLRPDGTVLAIGATGHSAIYNVRSGKWTAGPDLPVVQGEGQLDVADGPASLLVNGHVLIGASAGVFNTPAHFLEFDGKKYTEVAAPPGAASDSSYNINLLPLPNGQVLMTDFSNDVEIYTPTGKANKDWAPEIDNGCELERLSPGTTYALRGRGLNGLSQAAAYGDDEQAATNYPIVRITNKKTGHVVFARTHDHSYMGVAAGARSTTYFDVPTTIELGESRLVVIANGIASDPVAVDVAQPCNN